jgi:hypothetical protein
LSFFIAAQVVLDIFEEFNTLFNKMKLNKPVRTAMGIVIDRAEYIVATHAKKRVFQSEYYCQ